MDQRSVRVVVGRGDPSGTDIRAVLEDGGFQIAGEASSVEDLARLVQANPPDVVVLDDSIGVAAAQVVGELAPQTRLVVIWPAAVLPVAGATRIDAEDLQTSLAPAVATAAGVLLTGFTTIDRPEWIDTVRKDPASLREKLAASASMPVRPSVTELQRPHGYPAPSTGWRRKSSRPIVPVSAAAAAAAASPTADEDATVNRRLGMIALGGAVAAGALMIALSLGRTTPTVVSAEPFVPGISAPSNFIPNPDVDTPGDGHGTSPGGAQGGDAPGSNTGGGDTVGSGTTGSGTAPVTDTKDGAGTTPTIGVGTGGGSTGGIRAGSHQSSNTPGQGGGGGQGSGSHTSGTPGKSGAHNPHGAPPGQSGDHPGNGGQHPSHPAHPAQQRTHRHKR
jgi:hypothetical protein